MEFLQPDNLAAALAITAEQPEVVPINGGTDLMVELNFDRRRPDAIVDLSGVAELRGWTTLNDSSLIPGASVRIGAGTTWTTIERELAQHTPGLAIAARTVGSPQIRNRATIGGNVATASPAADGLPPLVAAGAVIEVASAERGSRAIGIADWMTGPKRSALAADELIVAVHVPAGRGPQQFSKIGTRNAMVIAVASFAIDIDIAGRRIGTGIGSAGPIVMRASEAEQMLESHLGASGQWDTPGELDPAIVAAFGELAGAAARPIDDVRGTAAYRRHAVTVMARRTLTWAWKERLTCD